VGYQQHCIDQVEPEQEFKHSCHYSDFVRLTANAPCAGAIYMPDGAMCLNV
jgi:hypothetical protein